MASGIRRFAQGVSPYLLVLIAIATLGPLQYGFHLAELNAPQDVITCQKKSISTLRRPIQPAMSASLPDCIPMTPATFATISSIFTVGGLAGALAAGPFTSSYGRLLSMRLTGVFFLLGSLVETLAGSAPLMGLGRLINGLGAGATTVIVPLYISEVAPPAARGFFGFFTQISINVGILTTQTLGYFLSHGSAWRWIMAMGAVLAGALEVGLLVVPESPAWTAASQGDVVRARRTIQRIRGKNANVDDEVAAWGGAEEPRSSEEEALLAHDGAAPGAPPPAFKQERSHLGFVQVVKDPLYRPAILAVVGIMFAQQLLGINSIIMYSVSLLSDLLPTSSALLTILISVVNLVMTIASAPLPDKLGRKTCLLVSIVGQGTGSLCLAFSIMFGVKILSAISVIIFVAFFAIGLGPVPFIMASELVGQEAVGATQSWALGASYIATFLVAQFFPIINVALNERFGRAGWVYFIFAAFAVVFAGFVAWKVPETKGKKDVDEVWGRTRRVD